MATGILGLGSDGSSSLNEELIEKLKSAEKTAIIDPVEEELATWETETEKFAEIKLAIADLLSASKSFDLYNNISGNTAFEDKTAAVSGSSALFDAVDIANLDIGNTVVVVNSLAQKDVHQSAAFTAVQKDATINQGDFKLTIQGIEHTFDTNSLTYEELAEQIDNTEGLTASVEEVGTDSYRLIIKSTTEGTANDITFNGANTLAFTEIQNATDLDATVDGIAYNNSSNEITVQGGALKITATEVGTSTLNVQKDTSSVVDGITEVINAYNAVVELVNDTIYSDDNPFSDTASIKSILAGIKSQFTSTYGSSNDKTLFSYGFELEKDGTITIDPTALSDAVSNNLDDFKEVLVGDAANKGIGTSLKEYIDDMNYNGGLLDAYYDNILERKTQLDDELETKTNDLDEKYAAMTARFAQYATIITQMESSFSGLKMMMQQSTSSN